VNVQVIASNKQVQGWVHTGHFPIRGGQIGANDGNCAVSDAVIFRLALSEYRGRFGSASVRVDVHELNGGGKAKLGVQHILEMFREQIDPSYPELPVSNARVAADTRGRR
jgi:hypothetical protein